MTKKKESKNNEVHLMSPKEIKAHLDQYVIGQDEAKKVLSVAVYNHFKKIFNNKAGLYDVEMEKSNIFLLGDTGCGKTLLAKTIANLLNVPCYIQDCTKITQAGYVGSDVEDCLVGLLRTCDYDVQRAEIGIVVLDEIDKVAKRDAGPSITRDVQGEGVQQSLLKMVEGDLVGVPPCGGRKHPEQPLIYVNTSNILFIGSGAFVGLDEIIGKRLGGRKIGFNADNGDTCDCENIKSYATTQDLRDFGMIPEFVGRFPIITSVEKLDEDALVSILNEPKNSIIKQYSALLDMDNTEITFTEGALKRIANLAFNLGTGARGLKNIVEIVMTDIMFESADNINKKSKKKITIDEDYVNEKTKSKFKFLKVA
jgi:ATP-dependent Clp protease ATP-binding subunit ClpX